MKPPEVQETSLASPPAPPPTATPPLLSPISPEVSLPSPALPPTLPPPKLPATSLLPPPPLPSTTSPPELLHEVAPPPPATKTPPLPPRPQKNSSSIPTSPAASSPPAASRPPHSKLPEVSPLEPNLLPSPELRTHLPIAPPQNSPDPKIISTPPSKTPTFFPTYDDPPPPPPPLVVSPPSSLISPTLSIGNQTTLDLQQSHVSTGIFLGCITGGVLLIAVLALLYLCTRNSKHPKKIDHGRPWLGLKDTSCAVMPQNWEQSLDIVTVQPQPQPQCSVHVTSYNSSSKQPFPPQDPILSCGAFTYGELEEATDGFSKVNLIGEGGFGYVHKGVLANGREVAVKKLKTRSKQGELEFQAEVETFSQVHHKHIVTLLGYCITGSERLLVYEFIPNKTLDFHLHGKEQPSMEWATRVKIAIGAAKGLAYLHDDCNPTIVHRDIKAANILLDFKFDAKVSDFGLANFFADKTNASCITHISTRVIGTFGYLAPEYASSGKVTEKSDVYSFGVMLLELITGCPPICRTQDPTMKAGLVGWARPLLTQALEDGNYMALADPSLQGNYDAGEMANMVASAAACVRHSPLLRPRMSQIVRVLEKDISHADLNEGRIPRHNTISGFLENSSTRDAYQYKENLKEYDRALASLEHGISRYSGNTSEYSLYKSESGSSCEMQRPA